mgnify:CR=1 FL=1
MGDRERGGRVPPLSRLMVRPLFVCLTACLVPSLTAAQTVRGTASYARIKTAVDGVPAIDTHDHLFPPDRLAEIMVETERGKGMTLFSLWRQSYAPQVAAITPRTDRQPFDDWWAKAKHDFDNARATGFYRYQTIALRDLHGVDYDRISDEQANDLDARIFDLYRDDRWIQEVVTRRANIEVLVNDPYWDRFGFRITYPFEVQTLNVSTLLDGFHPSEYKKPADDPYAFAASQGMTVASLDDYLAVLDRLFQFAKEKGAVCLKTTRAYDRTLLFDKVPKERAAALFGKARRDLPAADVKAFQDFIMWELVERSARFDLPIQIHTGHGKLQGSNPVLLLDLIEANPKTKFILFHGGYPWVGETGAMLLRHGRHVWIDSVWLPTISPTMARRAFHEWLEVMPADRILWGADCNHAEGIYGATVVTREVIAEVLAEKVERGDLTEEHAVRIGRQVLRENALALFPTIRERVAAKP